jgi:hypothetical protein
VRSHSCHFCGVRHPAAITTAKTLAYQKTARAKVVLVDQYRHYAVLHTFSHDPNIPNMAGCMHRLQKKNTIQHAALEKIDLSFRWQKVLDPKSILIL